MVIVGTFSRPGGGSTGGLKKKTSLKKKLLIGAAVGAGAYVAYKVGL